MISRIKSKGLNKEYEFDRYSQVSRNRFQTISIDESQYNETINSIKKLKDRKIKVNFSSYIRISLDILNGLIINSKRIGIIKHMMKGKGSKLIDGLAFLEGGEHDD